MVINELRVHKDAGISIGNLFDKCFRSKLFCNKPLFFLTGVSECVCVWVYECHGYSIRGHSLHKECVYGAALVCPPQVNFISSFPLALITLASFVAAAAAASADCETLSVCVCVVVVCVCCLYFSNRNQHSNTFFFHLQISQRTNHTPFCSMLQRYYETF